MRRFVAALVALAAVGGLLLFSPAPEASATLGYTRVQNGYNNLCLAQNGDWSWHVNGATSYSYVCNASLAYERWTWQSSPDVYRRIQNWATEGCLNGDTSRAYQNYPCSLGAQWEVGGITGYAGAYYIRSHYNTAYCLAAPSWNNNQPILVSCNLGYSDQRWYFMDNPN